MGLLYQGEDISDYSVENNDKQEVKGETLNTIYYLLSLTLRQLPLFFFFGMLKKQS
jgi:hypothetical protein